MDHLQKDIRFAFRTFTRSRAFAAVAVLAIAIAIGVNTAIFSVIDAVLLRPLPYGEPERIVALWNTYGDIGPSRAPLAPPEFAEITEQTRSFAQISGFTDRSVNLTGADEPVRLQGFAVSPNFFQTLGVAPMLGRTFAPNEGGEGSEPVVVLSHDVWRTRFGGDRAIIGTILTLNGTPHTVIGVMPRGIRFPEPQGWFFSERADMWIARDWMQAREQSRGNQFLRTIARLTPGATYDGAARELGVVMTRFRAGFPDRYAESTGWRLLAVPLTEQVVGPIRPALLVLAGAVGLVLLIACANVANLLLARATGREREIAIRTALGADRIRLVRQLLTESVMLAVFGASLGALLATWGIGVLTAIAPADVPRLDEAVVNPRALVFSFLLALATGVLFGLVPAIQQSRPDVTVGLSEGGRGGSAGGRNRRLRGALVMAEVALAVVVLVGAGLLLRSMHRLTSVDPGFRSERVLSFHVALPAAKYPRAVDIAPFNGQLIDRLGSLPGVVAVGTVNPLPLSGDGWSASFDIEGRTVAPGEQAPHAEHASVRGDYFKTMSIPLLEGRTFTEQDVRESPGVAIVDVALARKYFGGGSPIGKRINPAGGGDTTWATIVGVVGHVHNAALRDAGEPQVYVPALQHATLGTYYTVRVSGEPIALASSIGAAVRSIDSDQPVSKVRPMGELLDSATARERFQLVLLSIFAGAALLLATLGIYGVMAYAVALRTREIGIRIALGAAPRGVLSLVVRQGLRLTAAGVLIGALLALGASRLMSGMLFGVSPTDPVVFGSIALMLVLVAALATYLPARRAARVDPVTALRAE
ncbi:MAG TPA: ABC transporter permease [Gemmatimonadaceae bacterium]|nr:ABC transporter permease [Gemmatimonadaceae bacterium]